MDSPESTSTAETGTPVGTLWSRAYQRNYYLNHRSTECLDARELERCRQQPTLIREIRGPNWIACPLCGLLFGSLSPHLRSDHSAELGAEIQQIAHGTRFFQRSQLICLAFRKRFSLAKNFPLVCQKQSEVTAKRIAIANRTPKASAAVLRERIKRANEGRIEWGVTQAQREARSRNLRRVLRPTTSGKWELQFRSRVRDSQVAELRLAGVTEDAIAKACGITREPVRQRLRKMGFPPRLTSWFHGAPVGGRHLGLLIEDWIAVHYETASLPSIQSAASHQQFTVTEAAKILGVSRTWIHEHARQSRRRPSRTIVVQRLGSRRGSRRLLYLGNAQLKALREEQGRIEAAKLRRRALLEIAGELKVQSRQLHNALRARLLSKKLGDLVVGLWGVLKVTWRSKASAGTKGGAPKKLLPSEQSILRERYSSLRIDLRDLAEKLKLTDRKKRDSLWSRVAEWICYESKRGHMRTLLHWPEFFAWADRDREWKIGAGHWRPGDLAMAFLASQFLIKDRTIKEYLLA